MSSSFLLSLAQQYGTPLYVYDAHIIKERYCELKSWFNYPKTKIFYAMKANYNPTILKVLLQEGANIDAVSPTEILLALKVGFKPEQILYTANMMSDEEIHEVQKLNVLFNIGSLSELERYGQFYPHSSVCLRFNPDVIAGHHEKVKTGGKDTKFGISLEDVEIVKEISKQYHLAVIGIHEHTGSGIPLTSEQFQGILNTLSIITKENFPDLEFVDFGGGFKIPYKESESRADYAEFGKKLVTVFKQCCNTYGKVLQLYFEPGRYLVAEAGTLLVKATTLKQNGNKKIAGVNSGFNHLIRPILYDAYHQILNLSHPHAAPHAYDIVGNICETGDHFAKDRSIPQVSEGDILAICDTGAYGYAMGSIYNLRSMPAEIIIEQGTVLHHTPALTAQELVRRITGSLD
ncbi:diaminopimelate decarboxylase [Candidatus Woesearchaeota archaeon]|nr:diaminopimelate decarboxylase [Candidatus Woesearchaeota archaeon]